MVLSLHCFLLIQTTKAKTLDFHYWKCGAHSSCYSFEHKFPSTIINAINDIDSSEYLLERDKIEFEAKIKYKQNTKDLC